MAVSKMVGKAVVIPAYNEEKTIAQVITRVPPEYFVIVVDDASKDGTWNAITAAGRRRNLLALKNETNLGAGGALKKGVQAALSRQFDEVFCLDADGQHTPEKLPELSNALEEGFDCAFASRFLDKQETNKMPFARKMGNRFFALKTNLLFGTNYTDVLCGMRGFRKEALEKLLPQMREEKYGNALEIACLAGRNKLKVKEITIPVAYFLGRKNNYSLPSLLLQLLATLIKTFFRK